MAGQTIVISVLADTKKFSSAMGKIANETGLDKLAKGARTAGAVVAGVTAAVVGTGAAVAGLAIKGGFARALNIEDAQAALKGLGHDTASITKIMDSAMASVRGTSFGLGDAAQIASTAVAAGIAPGDKLTRTLKLTANAAALARVDLGDMGSILNKVWTAGRVQTTELNQLADRGIPIWTKLAEHYGVNADELRKMVSAGKVDAETFATVLEGTVGTAADEMGKTVRGSWQNMFAALSRVGEKLISGVFPKIAGGIQGVTGFIDQAGPIAEKVGAAIGQWVTGTALPALETFGRWFTEQGVPALRTFADWFTAELLPRLLALVDFVQTRVLPALAALGAWIVGTLVPALVELGGWIVRNRDWLGAIAVVVGTLVFGIQAYIKVMAIWRAAVVAATAVQALFNTVMKANPIGLIILAITALVAGIVYFFTQTETGKRIWDAVWTGIQATAQAVGEWFTKTLVPALSGAWDKITAAAGAVGDFFTRLWDGVRATTERLWAIVLQIVGVYVSWVIGALNALGAIPGRVGAWFGQMRDGVVNAFNNTVDFVRNIPAMILAALAGLGGLLIDTGRRMMDGLKDGIASAARGLADTVLRPVRAAVDGVKSFLGIRSPSRVFRGIGENVGDGLTQGLRRLSGVRAAMRTMSQAVTGDFDPTLTLSANARPGAGAGNTYQITVQAGVGDPVAIGRELTRVLRAFERANGGR